MCPRSLHLISHKRVLHQLSASLAILSDIHRHQLQANHRRCNLHDNVNTRTNYFCLESYSAVIAKVGEADVPHRAFIDCEFPNFFGNAADFLSQPAQNICGTIFSSKTMHVVSRQSLRDCPEVNAQRLHTVQDVTRFFRVVLNPCNTLGIWAARNGNFRGFDEGSAR